MVSSDQIPSGNLERDAQSQAYGEHALRVGAIQFNLCLFDEARQRFFDVVTANACAIFPTRHDLPS
jgi:hypothetical protein